MVTVLVLPQNIFFCVLQNKESHTGLERGWINDDRIYIFRCTIPLTYHNFPCPLTDVYFLNIGGAVMLLVYEYVSGWLQKNWWSSAHHHQSVLHPSPGRSNTMPWLYLNNQHYQPHSKSQLLRHVTCRLSTTDALQQHSHSLDLDIPSFVYL